ncbi:MAG: hypothetical protein QGG50_04855 [Methanopyri archaeon]|nr:hypothetical protein [Methanopyri archaeon]
MRVIRPCTSKGGFVLEFPAGRRLGMGDVSDLLAPVEDAKVLSTTPVVVMAEVGGVRVSVHPRKLLVLTREKDTAQKVAERVYDALFPTEET